MFWNRNTPPKATAFTWREWLGLLLPPFGVIVFIVGWCFLMIESGHATRYGESTENLFKAVPPLTRASATVSSLWLFVGTGITVFGLLIARKQFTLYILLFIAGMIGASGALPYLFLKQ